MKLNRIPTFLLAAAILLGCVSCASDPSVDTPDDTDDDTAAVTEKVKEEKYPYETPDMNGYTLRIFNSDELWDMFMKVDTKATDGEVLNDAVYNRNRKVEQMLNCNIDVTLYDIAANNNDVSTMTNVIKETVLSGDDTYDVIYSSVYTAPAMVTDGYFFNLLDVDGLHLDEPWWDEIVVEQNTIEDCLYFASSPMQLMSLDGAWCLYFNENMMAANDLELPYDTVRAGKWTVAKLMEYQKAITNLNGDDSFAWSASGNSVYGISSHGNSADKFILGCKEFFVRRNSDGIPEFAADEARFADTLTVLAQVLDNTNGYTIFGSNTDFDAEAGGYVYIFSVGRSLFLTGEIKAAQELRDMKDTFGILPYPKLDESQDSYYSSFVNQCLFYTIPVTNTAHLKETAVISDAISYQSYKDVLPVYYSNVVEQKGLRNDDSIEMLNLIRETSTIDPAVLFGWSTSLLTSLRTSLFKGDGALTSTIETQRSSIETSIQKTLDAIHNTQANS